MKLSAFDYDLPERLIAQEPAAVRDGSRLMVLDRSSGRIEHRVFRDLPALLRPGDLLVVNDTRVIPARLLAVKPSGGRIEVLLLEKIAPHDVGRGGKGEGGPGDESAGDGATRRREVWKALVRGFGKAGEAARFTFPGGLSVEIAGREADGEIARVILTAEGRAVAEAVAGAGSTPTPPYIRRAAGDARSGRDRERYQTVYAAADGAVAAPTAGLHFTGELLSAIRAKGVGVEALTLHVGWGTFQPVRVEEVEEHKVEPETILVPDRLVAAVAAARRAGGRVIAVGTTVTRALEFAARGGAGLAACTGRCDLVIRPGHAFRVVDALVTNFHLPRSSLLILAAAFAGRERILDAYREAVAAEYRFYSYGDAMLIL